MSIGLPVWLRDLTRATFLGWLAALCVAAAGGYAALLIGTPLPWLLGGMLATAGAMAMGLKVMGQPLTFPQTPRMIFIAVIGVAIGGTATPGMWTEVVDWWSSLVAVGVFVGVAHLLNYQLFRRVGRYDRATAFYCATPGGLIESLQLGEEAGGNVPLLTVQHFGRIALTVTLVPLLYWAMRGEAVGSAAGVSLEPNDVSMNAFDLFLLVGCGLIGGWGGRKVGFPAAIITGPVILSTLVHALGWTEAQPPDWLIAVAQLVIGLGLAMRFQGLTRDLLARGFGLCLTSVMMMLAIGAGLAWALSLTEAHSFQVLFMCYAPGGVVEMGLIALSLGVSPVLVTLHHMIRIGFTVVVIPLIGRRFLA